jgi:tetratricopeptide (TPR) repeat protein
MSLSPPKYAGASSFPPPAFSLEAPIEDPERIVDAILASLARGRLASSVWDDLHAAARRDGCVDAVAAAFGAVSSAPHIKGVQPSVSAEFHFQAARFFGEVAGDDLGAAMHLEEALTLAPAHAEAFARMEALLEQRRSLHRLAELYAAAAPHRPRGQQALMLRRAADLIERAAEEGGDRAALQERAIATWEEIARLEPGDYEARSRLEALCVEAGRFRDAVRLNEQSLAREPAPDDYSRGLLLERIIALYADRLGQPERAVSRVEELLALDPANAVARAVAERLLSVKGLEGRVAAMLTLASHGKPHEVERFLSIELETARGARRTQLYADLGKLREERLGEAAGALEAYDQVLALDPSNDPIRRRYVAIAARLECHADAVRVLERVLAAVKDPAVALLASVELGEALLGQRNVKRAKSVLAEVYASLSTPPEVRLRAARSLRPIHEANYDRRALCDVLDRIVLLTDDDDERRESNVRLAAEALKLKDTNRAIEAYERLLPTSARTEALEVLSKLCRVKEQRERYAALLEAERGR